MRFPRRACACAGAIAWTSAIAGCDPSEAPPVSDNGPAFLLLARSGTQPEAGGGIDMYIQSRGGNYVGVLTTGCTHALGPYSGVTQSCGQTAYYSSQPLYLTVYPEAHQQCTVEARLYSICDCTEAGIPYDYASGSSVYMWCDSTGVLVTTQVATFGAPSADASTDGAVPDGGDGGVHDAGSSTLDSSGDS
jgi:hypothetical protein